MNWRSESTRVWRKNRAGPGELDLDPDSAVSEAELQVAFGLRKQAGYVLMKIVSGIILARRWSDEQLVERYGLNAPLQLVALIRPALAGASATTADPGLASDEP